MDKNGSINVIIGCMFSGKTSQLIKIAKRYSNVNKNVLMINYSEDKRYGDDNKVYTHDLIGLDCIFVKDLNKDIQKNPFFLEKYRESEVICINEGQFYTGLVDFCRKSANNDNKEIHVCGLDGDYLQKPFGEILNLIPIAETTKKLNALCKICNNGNLAYFTKRISNSQDQYLIGGKGDYIPVCRTHL